MRYIPHTPEERQHLLDALHVAAVDELFQDIPAAARLDRPLNIPPALTELELRAEMTEAAARNVSADQWPTLLGGGFYHRFIPAAVGALASRGEFLTAYTPYQAELSQGTLAVIYEFQTMMASLTGLDAAQASMYDGASAVGEACLLAVGETGRPTVVMDRRVLPDYRQVAQTYLTARGARLLLPPTGASLREFLDTLQDPPALVAVQQPDVLGMVHDWRWAADWARERGALSLAIVDPVALAVLEPPGAMGFDIAVGEGQPLGNHLQYGGPSFGFFTVRSPLLRRLPGRIVGATVDREGARGFVLTLQAREQHIRRERATSNICSNHSLNALQATIYLSLLGPEGLREVARLSSARAHYLGARLESLGIPPAAEGPYLYERAYRLPRPAAELNRHLLAARMIGGADMGVWDPEWTHCWQVAVTELSPKQQLDAVTEEVARWMSR